ncbi:MAG: hypothetical protein WAK17_08110 [Candidatus Nitrosopolaris sp.]
MVAIADDRHFNHDNEIELVQFLSEMKKEGDLNNEENLDSYLTLSLCNCCQSLQF